MNVEKYTRLARTALALERHFLAESRYPDDLALLVPEYMSTVPLDLMDGTALRYQPAGDKTRFLLYSVGWNRHLRRRSGLAWSYALDEAR